MHIRYCVNYIRYCFIIAYCFKHVNHLQPLPHSASDINKQHKTANITTKSFGLKYASYFIKNVEVNYGIFQ